MAVASVEAAADLAAAVAVFANIQTYKKSTAILTKKRATVKTVALFYFDSLYFNAAPTKPLNKGCGLFGRDLNSGWNCTAIYHGWSLISIISTMRLSGALPEKIIPALYNRCLLQNDDDDVRK